MDKEIAKMQSRVLEEVAREKDFGFALAGGTALERYYLHHRFSRDLDFFAAGYNPEAAEKFMDRIQERLGCITSKEGELIADHRARVIFYSLSGKGWRWPLKVDFVEDVLIDKPEITRRGGVPVYSVKDIYFHKIVAVSGTGEQRDIAGRALASGRNEPRDAFDLYVLSIRVEPLHSFIKTIPRMYQKRFIRWVQTYSRMDMKIGLIDLDIYLEGFDAREMIRHIDNQAREFMRGLT